jgi:hypothetical protein
LRQTLEHNVDNPQLVTAVGGSQEAEEMPELDRTVAELDVEQLEQDINREAAQGNILNKALMTVRAEGCSKLQNRCEDKEGGGGGGS